MGRPGLSANRKFKRLARTLGCPCLARGVLELIWDTCYEAGDAFLGDLQDVAAAANWTGDPGVLVKALFEAGGEGRKGFIEDCLEEPGNYICHDLWDHAPEYVERRARREIARQAKGLTLRDMRAAAGRASGEARRMKANSIEHVPQTEGTYVEQIGTHDEQVMNMCSTHDEQTRTNDETPSPSPSTEVPPVVPQGGQSKKMSRRRTKSEKVSDKIASIGMDIPEDLAVLANKITDLCPEYQPEGGVIRVDPGKLVERLAGILALTEYTFTPELLLMAWKLYVESTPKCYKAPQYFFGDAEDQKNPEAANWKPWARIAVRRMKDGSNGQA
jgi:hypothetical protein